MVACDLPLSPSGPARGRRRRQLSKGVPAPRATGLSDLLSEIDGLRTTLQAGLSLVAAAVDAEFAWLGAELVDGEVRAVRAFEGRALAHLCAMAEASRTDARADSIPHAGDDSSPREGRAAYFG